MAYIKLLESIATADLDTITQILSTNPQYLDKIVQDERGLIYKVLTLSPDNYSVIMKLCEFDLLSKLSQHQKIDFLMILNNHLEHSSNDIPEALAKVLHGMIDTVVIDDTGVMSRFENKYVSKLDVVFKSANHLQHAAKRKELLDNINSMHHASTQLHTYVQLGIIDTDIGINFISKLTEADFADELVLMLRDTSPSNRWYTTDGGSQLAVSYCTLYNHKHYDRCKMIVNVIQHTMSSEKIAFVISLLDEQNIFNLGADKRKDFVKERATIVASILGTMADRDILDSSIAHGDQIFGKANRIDDLINLSMTYHIPTERFIAPILDSISISDFNSNQTMLAEWYNRFSFLSYERMCDEIEKARASSSLQTNVAPVTVQYDTFVAPKQLGNNTNESTKPSLKYPS